MELNNITNTGTWGEQATRLNDNFNKVALGIDTLQSAYQRLSQSAIEAVDTLPQTGEANKIYRLVGTTSYSDYMYNTDDLTTPILMATYNNAIENEPTPGSNNLVKSGGVAAAIVFDISAYHATGSTLATYADLTSALGTNGANVPSEVRKGGMSIKFVQTSDNKYVQYRLMSAAWSTIIADWQLESVTFNVENSEYILVVVDDNGRCVKGITKDGSIHIFSDLSLNGNKEYGEDNGFFIKYVCDKDGKILEGIDKRGNKILYTNVNVEGEFMLKGKKISDITQNHIYHIGKGSDYKYTTLREGIAEATRYERSIVYVHEGTYDLIEEWRTEVSQRLEYQFGNRLCNGIELVFLAGSKVVAHAELNNEVRTNFNPFYIEGSCSIIGLNIDVSNVRYCVHDEGLGQFKADIYYKNCVMKNHSDIYIDAEGKPHCFYQCIGGGMGAHTNVHIENCVFDSAKGGDTNANAVSYHNGISNYNCEGSVFVSNCYFAGQNSLRAQSYGVSTKMSMMYANNNSFGNPIECINENTHKNFDVLEWNNVIRN